jgi:LiaF transmembrane domain
MDETNGENQERPQAPTQPALPAAPPYYAPPPPAPKGLRAPLVALALSVFPGGGQIYNGQLAKALFVFFAFVGSIYATVEVEWVFAFCIFFVYFFNLIDAYRTAVLSNERAAGGGRVEEPVGAESPLWGALLIGLGLLILLHNLGLVRLAAVGRLWPLALVVAGGFFIYQASQRKKDPPSGGSDAFLS